MTANARLGVLRAHLAAGANDRPGLALVPAAAGADPIAQRPLFPAGPLVSCIGLGAWPLAGAHGPVDQADGIEAVYNALWERG